MTINNNKLLKINAYKAVTNEDAQGLRTLHQEIQRKARVGGQAANDTLYGELEARYGSGFAQWVVDRMNSVIMKEKAE